MVWSVTRAISASDHGVWYGHSVLCLTVSRQLSPRQAVSPIPDPGTSRLVFHHGKGRRQVPYKTVEALLSEPIIDLLLHTGALTTPICRSTAGRPSGSPGALLTSGTSPCP